VKVIVPVGAAPPLNVAVSLIAAPRVTPGEACVVSVVVRLATTTVSFGALQALAVPALFASPL
jgi:hypothetical protein